MTQISTGRSVNIRGRWYHSSIPLASPIVEDILKTVAEAVCQRPGQSASRTSEMVHATLGFEPRDGLKYILATLAFGHFKVSLDSMRDVFSGQTETMKALTKSGIVALDRENGLIRLAVSRRIKIG